jgi:hypothetical protein
MDLALVLLVSAALALGLPPFLVSMWRQLPPIWRGERRSTPVEDFRLFSVLPRSYLTGLLAITGWCGGFALLGAGLLVGLVFGGMDTSSLGDSPVLFTVVATLLVLGGVLLAVAVPLTVLQWVVNAFNRPRRLVPPKYRTRPGSIGDRARRRKRTAAALPPTEHLVEIFEADPGPDPQDRFLVALCAEPGCGWTEYSDPDSDGTVGDGSAAQTALRAAVVRQHSSRVAPGVTRRHPNP